MISNGSRDFVKRHALLGDVVINLDTRRYRPIDQGRDEPPPTYAFALSADKSLIAACGAWGLAVWDVPQD